VNKIKDGINDKVGNCIQFLSTFIAGMIIAFTKGWLLTLIILALSPVLFTMAVVLTKVIIRLSQSPKELIDLKLTNKQKNASKLKDDNDVDQK
jgi:ABC-type multidrug transport system fused ATPase/permease subunit